METSRILGRDFDKLIIILAGGALGLTIPFLADALEGTNITGRIWLVSSWICFIISLASILFELLFGIHAHNKAIKQIDIAGKRNETFGGIFAWLSEAAQIFATIFLILGLALLLVFAFYNVGV